MSYQVYENYQYPSYSDYRHGIPPPLVHQRLFSDQEPRFQPCRHSSHSSFSHHDEGEYFHEPQYETGAHHVNFLPATVSAQALEENGGSYSSPSSSPRSRHSEHLPSSPVPRHLASPQSPTDGERAFCSHPACLDDSGRPVKSFSRKADVARHVRSSHKPRYLDCPYKKCVRKGAHGFTRQDHLVEHRRGFHMEVIAKRGGAKEGSTKGRHEA